MSFDASKVDHAVAALVGEMPHPDAPAFKVKDYETWARVAARLNETGSPSADQMAHAHQLLSGAGLAPAEFERLWDIAKPLANRLLDQPPKIQDLAMLAGARPHDVRQFYMDHPHPEVPEITAGDYAQYHAAAEPYARVTQGRAPVHHEIRRFALANYSKEDIQAHYTDDGTLGGLVTNARNS